MFRVSLEQLRAAAGDVRCGACLHTFNAIDFVIAPELLDQARPIVPSPSTAQTNARENPTEPDKEWIKEVEAALGDLDDETIDDPDELEKTLEDALMAEGVGQFEDDNTLATAQERDAISAKMEMEQILASASGTTTLDKEHLPDAQDDLEHITPDVQELLDNSDDIHRASIQASDVIEQEDTSTNSLTPSTDTLSHANSPEQIIDLDSEPPLTATKPADFNEISQLETYTAEASKEATEETSFEQPSIETEASKANELLSDVETESHTEPLSNKDTPQTQDRESQHDDPIAHDPALSILMEDLALTTETKPSEAADVIDTPDAHSPRKTQGRWLNFAILAMVLLFAIQWASYHWQGWAQSPAHRAWLNVACKLTGCQLPPLIDIEKLSILDHVLTQRPGKNRVWRLDLQVRNDAHFDQPFPAIELTLMDRGGQILAARRFSPREYAPTAPQLLKRGQVAHIAFDLQLDVPDVPSYEIRFTPIYP